MGFSPESYTFMDFKIGDCQSRDDFCKCLERYVDFYNNHRPCFAIGYDTPNNYRKRYYKGEILKKNTFENRVLSDKPKFVQKQLQKEEVSKVSTFENQYL